LRGPSLPKWPKSPPVTRHLDVDGPLGGEITVDEGAPDKPVLEVKLPREVTDDNLSHLGALKQLVALRLDYTSVTDKGLAHLEGLTSLQELDLGKTKITDKGLVHLKGLTNLKTLSLASTQIRGEGLIHLKGLSKLEGLYLYRSQVTDEGLAHLKGLTRLQSLHLGYTATTDKGHRRCAAAAPRPRAIPGLPSRRGANDNPDRRPALPSGGGYL
jgi:hypothetical protein